MSTVLIVDDEEIVRFALSEKIKEHGFSVMTACGGREAVAICRRENINAVLLDLKMPEMDGIQTLKELKKHNGDVPVIIVTAHGDIPTAVQAIKLGAYDFIEKPPQISKLLVTLTRAIEKAELETRVKNLDTTLETSFEWLMGRSSAMKGVIDQIKQVSRSDFSIILQGETGTGKSFLANAIHNLSGRSRKEFVKVDISVIPENLVESELFGHEKGAFTSADKKKKGYFEAARQGTLFIDELENMSLYMQTKLLSAVEDRKIYLLGNTNPVDINVRFIAASNKDLKKLVAKNEFRKDLFYRLSEFIITLPPLRERVEDIPLLASKFLIEAAAEMNKQIKEFDTSMSCLVEYEWPGNIRELKNVIRRAVLMSEDGVVRQKDIRFLLREGEDLKENTTLFPLKEAVTAIETKAIKEALHLNGGNRSKAAALLQIDYKTLLSRIKDYNIK
ncbi:MAG: sigma-54-dependent Fis family transcriptional regulator [Nitrospirae bacterium]|nr:sigma-54-dependent Fis family transcriptional regulator [Nitrospirota bacterium]